MCTWSKASKLALEQVHLSSKNLTHCRNCSSVRVDRDEGNLTSSSFTHQQIKLAKSDHGNENFPVCNRLKTCRGKTRQRRLVFRDMSI